MSQECILNINSHFRGNILFLAEIFWPKEYLGHHVFCNSKSHKKYDYGIIGLISIHYKTLCSTYLLSKIYVSKVLLTLSETYFLLKISNIIATVYAKNVHGLVV